MKIAVFYYTQTGQALEAAKSVCRPIEEADDGSHVICKEIEIGRASCRERV